MVINEAQAANWLRFKAEYQKTNPAKAKLMDTIESLSPERVEAMRERVGQRVLRNGGIPTSEDDQLLDLLMVFGFVRPGEPRRGNYVTYKSREEAIAAIEKARRRNRRR